MAYEPYSCDLDSDTKTILHMYLFKNVRNMEAIKDNIISGSWYCAVIKASLIVHPLQVAVAANRALVMHSQDTMITKSINTEILYNLSLTKNISQSLAKFGVDKDNNLLICFVDTGHGDDSALILPQVEGELCPLSALSTCTRWQDVKSAYKLNNLSSDADLLDVIISRMVTKNFVSY